MGFNSVFKGLNFREIYVSSVSCVASYHSISKLLMQMSEFKITKLGLFAKDPNILIRERIF
jgi:hypothetical protein